MFAKIFHATMAVALLRIPITPEYRSLSLAGRVPATPVRTTASLSVDLKTCRPEVTSAISCDLSHCLSETHLHQTIPKLGPPATGKVRDIYEAGDFLILVATDRLSAFDRILAAVPFKGQVLNQTSLWWFNSTKHITPNAVVSAPDPNVTIASKCTVFPVEFVVRGYVTGSTSTSLWTVYDKGLRNYCGNDLPDGLVKNQRLSQSILTPTTKAVDHDIPISKEEIVEEGLMTQKDFEDVKEKALALFAFGQVYHLQFTFPGVKTLHSKFSVKDYHIKLISCFIKLNGQDSDSCFYEVPNLSFVPHIMKQVAEKHGLILVDTKYEFGKAPDGSILLIDEVHTPDSSRYWVSASYEDHFRKGLEPENIDKEFLRLWFRENCDPYNDEVLPRAPRELVTELAKRYILLHDIITGEELQFPDSNEPIHDRISKNVAEALRQLTDMQLSD